MSVEPDLFGNVDKSEYDKLLKQTKELINELDERNMMLETLAEKADWYDEKYDCEYDKVNQ